MVLGNTVNVTNMAKNFPYKVGIVFNADDEYSCISQTKTGGSYIYYNLYDLRLYTTSTQGILTTSPLTN